MKWLKTAILAATLSGCSSVGTLGDVLGGVLNAPNNNQSATGTVQSVDTRTQQIFLRQSDGSTVSVSYDNNTQVVYQNQSYAVTALERGDQVQARIQNNGNSYYTDRIEVVQSVSSTSNTGSGQLYNIQGTVRQVDTVNGVFTMDVQNGNRITVSMPYNARSTDVTRFRNLRSGDWVQFQAVYMNETRVELRSFN